MVRFFFPSLLFGEERSLFLSKRDTFFIDLYCDFRFASVWGGVFVVGKIKIVFFFEGKD